MRVRERIADETADERESEMSLYKGTERMTALA